MHMGRLASLRWEDVVKCLASLWKTNIGAFEPCRAESIAAVQEMADVRIGGFVENAKREELVSRILGATEGAGVTPRCTAYLRKAPSGAESLARWWTACEKADDETINTIDLLRSSYSDCLQVNNTEAPLWTTTPDLLETLAAMNVLVV